MLREVAVHAKKWRKPLRVRHVCIAAALLVFLCILGLWPAAAVYRARQELPQARMNDGAEIYRSAAPSWAFVHVEERGGPPPARIRRDREETGRRIDIIYMNYSYQMKIHEPWQIEVEGGGWTWRWRMNF